MLRRTNFNVSIDVWSKMSSNRIKSGASRKYENFNYIARSNNTNDINEYTKKGMNTSLYILWSITSK